MITISICWDAILATLIFLGALVLIVGWFFLGLHLTSKTSKTLKTIGWTLIGLFGAAIILFIYFSFALEMCAV